MIPIDWDSRTPTAFPDGFTLTLKTGVSMGLQNRLTSLALPISVDELPPRYVALKRPSTMRDPFDRHNRIAVLDEARHIVRDLEGLQAELAKLDRPTYDAVPEMIVYSRQTVRGLLRVVIIWGMVLNGSVSKGRRVGDWCFILCLRSELSQVLSDVFKLDRWFEQDAPKRIEPPKPKRAAKPVEDMTAKRAAIERVLKEQGVRA